MESYLMGAEGSNRASESGSEVGSLVGFLLGCPGSEMGYAEGGPLRESSSSKSSGKINGVITLSLSYESLSSVYINTAPRGWWVHSPL